MTDVLHAYASLKHACDALDKSGDHAVAAYIGHGMALLETKYGIDPHALCHGPIAEMTPPARSLDHGNWA